MIFMITVHQILHVLPMPVVMFVHHRPVRLFLRDKILSELCAPFVNSHSMSYNVRAASCCIGKFAALHPCVLEGRHTVDRIEQTQKAYGFDGATERFPERAHELQELLFFRFLAGLAIFAAFLSRYSTLPFLERS
jgi:hypothetical protein